MSKYSKLPFKICVFIFLFLPFITFAEQPKQYLITAATSGLGAAICETLAQEGHALILAGRDETKLKLLKSTLENKYQGQYFIELFDYTDQESIQRLSSQLKKYVINGLVIIPPRIKITSSEMPSSDEWLNMFNLGFIRPLEIIKQTLSFVAPESSIVIISGLSSVHYLPDYKNSNVLRTMWIAEAKNLAYQFGTQALRVNSISPNVILTDFQINKIKERALKQNKSFNELLNEETASIPLHRYGQPQDIAHATAFLLSSKAAYINGTNLIIDGGLSKSY